ncbi:MAG: glutathione S-transferase family protein [Pseudomonadales bacterium]
MDLILHHFDISPFAEKVRLAFGIKQTSWKSVQIPLVMPKPDLTALTGGYRKTPVLQIGADIYCDTQRIAVELERRLPERTLFPDGSDALTLMLAQWSDVSFFRPAAALSMGTNRELPEDILEDRRQFFSYLDFATLEVQLPHFYSQFSAHAALLNRALASAGDFLLGDAPAWADILGYFPIWTARSNIAGAAERLELLPALLAWEQRMRAVGHGERRELDAGAALEIARSAASTVVAEVSADAQPPLAVGQAVTVAPDDYGVVPVHGELLRLTRDDIAIRRADPRAGEVVVHFPRIGYRVEPG